MTRPDPGFWPDPKSRDEDDLEDGEVDLGSAVDEDLDS